MTLLLVIVTTVVVGSVVLAMYLQVQWDVSNLMQVPKEAVSRYIPRPTLTEAQLRRRLRAAVVRQSQARVTGKLMTYQVLLVRISEADADILCPDEDYDLLAADLCNLYLANARRENWTLRPARVLLDVDPVLARGIVRVIPTSRLPEAIHGDSDRQPFNEYPLAVTDGSVLDVAPVMAAATKAAVAATQVLTDATARELTAPKLVLVALSGEGLFMVGPRTTMLGRANDCEVPLKSDIVSRHHALLTRNGKEYTLEDQGAVNGTYVNEVRITQAVALTEGDVIGLGQNGPRLRLQRE